MLTTCCNNSRKRGRHTLQIIKDTIVNCLVLLFEGVPEVTIDQSQGSMIDSVKEGLNQLKKSLQDQPTKDGIKFLDLSPNPHHAPIQKKDINKDSKPHGEQDETSRPTQTHQDSKQHHHFLRQNKTESLHHNKLENT
jgi:hypothetical protein